MTSTQDPVSSSTETSRLNEEQQDGSGSPDSSNQQQPEAGTSQRAGPSKAPDIEPRGNKPNTITNKHVGLNLDSLPPIDENTMKECEECHMEFLRSYLYRNFHVFICDDCRDPRGVHELITRTDAKAKYILKDCDLDLRSPPLRYILKKNPYQSRGDMRLYLKFQVEERALQVHGSEEQLEEELEKREERRVVKKQRVYEKKMKSLSMQVRSSLYKRNTAAHEHEYGDAECINEDADLYRRTCKTCGHEWEYEEL